LVTTLLNKRYRLESELGRGASGTVYRAHDTVLDRAVAVKMLDGGLDEHARERLGREARAAAALNHPNIVAMYDSGEDNGRAFLVMELVEGANLRDAGALDLAQVVAVARQLCAALGHAHTHGIVHRDLKPANVLVIRERTGLTAKLADLGIALSRRATRITSEGTLLGTALYLAPEQALGPEVDGRADLYALGAVMYEQLAGRPPFTGDDPLAVISQHLHAPVVPPRTFRPDLPPGLESVIVRLLAKAPSDRFASAKEVDEALASAPLESAGETPVPSGNDRMALLDQLARGRLVGRRGELQQLRELWLRARHGQGHLALVSGEPGVGKTRLAHELIVFAQLNGGTVLRGGSYEYEAATPYLPFVEAVRGWARSVDLTTLRERLGDTARELARFAPEIETRLGPLEPNPPLPPHEERLRLFDQVARFFRALAAEDGLLLFIDDLHWADHGSLALLHYLLRNLRDARWLVVATYREVELGRDHPLAGSLVEWNRERLATRVSLGRFSLSETSALLATLFGQESVTEDFAEVMHRETEGNPFFIEEVVKALIEQGQIYRDDEGWQREAATELVIPQSIKAAVGRRLERLSAPCLEALHAAAALGKFFVFAELASAVALDEGALLDALDEACAAQLARPTSGESFAFTHDKIREVLYEELNPIRRRRLHMKIGNALETLYATSLDAHSPDLAHHYCEAGENNKGRDYSLRAAARSLSVFATDEAVGHLLHARECAEALDDEPGVLDLDRKLGDLYNLRGELGPAEAARRRVLDGLTDPHERAAAQVRLGDIYARNGLPQGMDLLNEALAVLDPVTQALDRAEALTIVGRYHHYRLEQRRAIEFFEQARVVLEPLDEPETLVTLYGYFAGAYQHLAEFEESMNWARRCLTLGERYRNPIVSMMGYEFLAEDFSALGDWRQARENARRNVEIGERTGALERLAWTAFPLALAAYFTGDLEDCVRETERGLALFVRTGDVRGSIFPRAVRAWALIDLGRDDEARIEAGRAFADSERVAQAVLRVNGRGAQAYIDLRRGEPARAVASGRECEAYFTGTDHRIGLTFMYPWFAEACVEARELEEAERALGIAIPLCEGCGAKPGVVRLMRARGMLHAARGDRDAAERDFAEALKRAEAIEMRPEMARTLAHRARLRRGAGDAKGAAADAKRAAELFKACGAVPELEKVKSEAG
jgi:tetratricopeptide (TPR) repeat protein/tRNA A-37 threonylcarbamoyl transferase component Bud32